MSLVGPNGAGKTTLIKALAGERELDGGKLRRGHNVKLGLLSQHAEELGRGAAPCSRRAQRATGLKPNEARALLGRSCSAARRPRSRSTGCRAASGGGSRWRSSSHSGANVLILDEPTNHLDLESREALEAALQAFQGALLLVSHDRALLDAVGTRTVAVEDETLHSYVGGWPEYVRVREERAEAERDGQARASRAPRPRRRRRRPAGAVEEPAAPRASSSSARSRRPRRRWRALEEELADPAAWNDPRSAAKSTAAPRGGEEGARGALRRVGGRRRLTRSRRPAPRTPAARAPPQSDDPIPRSSIAAIPSHSAWNSAWPPSWTSRPPRSTRVDQRDQLGPDASQPTSRNCRASVGSGIAHWIAICEQRRVLDRRSRRNTSTPASTRSAAGSSVRGRRRHPPAQQLEAAHAEGDQQPVLGAVHAVDGARADADAVGHPAHGQRRGALRPRPAARPRRAARRASARRARAVAPSV